MATSAPRARANKLGTRPVLDNQPTQSADKVAISSKAGGGENTRICVKNLPAHVDEKRLREIFSQMGHVSDVKLMKTAAGKSRKFCFIGFTEGHAAVTAVKHFNKSFLDTSKLAVELALPPGAKELARPWSKYSDGSSAHGGDGDKSLGKADKSADTIKESKIRQSKKDQSLYEALGLSRDDAKKLENDPEFKLYLQLRAPRVTQKFWENDDLATAATTADAPSETFEAFKKERADKKKKLKDSKGDGSDSDEEDDEAFANPSLDDGITTSGTITSTLAHRAAEKKKASAATDDDTIIDTPETKAARATANNTSINDLDYLKSKVATFDDDELEREANGTSAAATPSAASSHGDDDDDRDRRRAAAKLKRKGKAVTAATPDDDGEQPIDEQSDDISATAATAASTDSKESKTKSVLGRGPPPPLPPADVSETARLFLRNLPYTVTDEHLHDYFGRFGEIAEIHLPTDENKKLKGFGYITFLFPEHAAMALNELNEQIFQGRIMRITAAHSKPKSGKPELSDLPDDVLAKMTYKEKKEIKRKNEAGAKDTWNHLFIATNTALEATAAKYKASKADIVGPDSDNSAVKAALAETQVIKEAKEFLKEQGVNVDIFNQSKSSVERSKTVILVKNIPFDTEVDELRRMFSKHGTLGRVVLPPSKSMAVVEYIEASEAKKAFRAMAFKKFKHLPIYLEMAPSSLFTTAAPAKAGAVRAPANDQALTTPDDDAESESATIYVKNLNFTTVEDSLRKVFADVGELRTVTIARKKAPTGAGAKKEEKTSNLSMGYGFVEFKRKDDALKALKNLQDVQVDGHALSLKLSHRQAPSSSSSQSNDDTVKGGRAKKPEATDANPGTKLMIKNVPFEAPAKELRELFGTYGQIKRLRIPKKFDGTHRGFAFIDFVTKQEAKNAYEALRSTHFYGRHLVCEWANQDDDLDDIREKTVRKFQAGEEPVDKKKKRKTAHTSNGDVGNHASFASQFE